MNKQELDSALAFIDAPQGELQIILYASLESIAEPRKLDIGDNVKYLKLDERIYYALKIK